VSLNRDWVNVTVVDDGTGGAAPLGGGGLSGLRDRLDVLGGELDVVTSQGAGTTVRATIPLSASRIASSGLTSRSGRAARDAAEPSTSASSHIR
jgi:signal transduction histidine kinase